MTIHGESDAAIRVEGQTMARYDLLTNSDVSVLRMVTRGTRNQVGDAGEVHRLACNILMAAAGGDTPQAARAIHVAAIAADHALAHDLSPAGVPESAWDGLAQVAGSLALVGG